MVSKSGASISTLCKGDFTLIFCPPISLTLPVPALNDPNLDTFIPFLMAKVLEPNLMTPL